MLPGSVRFCDRRMPGIKRVGNAHAVQITPVVKQAAMAGKPDEKPLRLLLRCPQCAPRWPETRVGPGRSAAEGRGKGDGGLPNIALVDRSGRRYARPWLVPREADHKAPERVSVGWTRESLSRETSRSGDRVVSVMPWLRLVRGKRPSAVSRMDLTSSEEEPGPTATFLTDSGASAPLLSGLCTYTDTNRGWSSA